MPKLQDAFHAQFINLCIMVLCCFILASCGGSSGGSGGSGGWEANPLLSELAGGAASIGKAVSLSEVIGPGPAAGLGGVNQNNSINGFKVDGRIYFGENITWDIVADVKMQVSNGMLIAYDPESPVILSPNDVTIFDNGLAGVILREEEVPFRGTNGGSLSVAATEVAMLGGKAVDLEYTNFGYWEVRLAAKGKVDRRSVDTITNTVVPFTLVSVSARELPPSGSSSFRGVVLANAASYCINENDNKVASLVGTANLNVSPTATKGTLTLDFANFYTLSSDLYIWDSLLFSSGFTISASSKNTTGITLYNGASSGYLEGKFYGGMSNSNASEAVGEFQYATMNGNTYDTVTITSVITGSFGVKKR